MASDNLDKLRAHLQRRGKLDAGAQAEAKRIGGVEQKLLGAGATQPRTIKHAEVSGDSAGVDAFLVFDITYSMTHVIEAAKAEMRVVGEGILSASSNNRAAVYGVGDHNFTARERIGINHGDYGIVNPLTAEVATLQRQIDNLGHFSMVPNFMLGDNLDEAEAYECIAADMVGMMGEMCPKPRKPVVVLLGDSAPHGNTVGLHDHGCPHSKGPDSLQALAGVVHHAYFVDCAHGGMGYAFRDGTFGPVEHLSNTTYVPFGDVQDILGPAFVAMSKKAEGRRAYQNYLAELPASTSKRVAGLLGAGSSSLAKRGDHEKK